MTSTITFITGLCSCKCFDWIIQSTSINIDCPCLMSRYHWKEVSVDIDTTTASQNFAWNSLVIFYICFVKLICSADRCCNAKRNKISPLHIINPFKNSFEFIKKTNKSYYQVKQHCKSQVSVKHFVEK